MKRTVKIPNTFWDDHADRCAGQTGYDWEILKRTARETSVVLGPEAFENLKSDADYYASPDGPDAWPGIKLSARATLRRLTGSST